MVCIWNIYSHIRVFNLGERGGVCGVSSDPPFLFNYGGMRFGKNFLICIRRKEWYSIQKTRKEGAGGIKGWISFDINSFMPSRYTKNFLHYVWYDILNWTCIICWIMYTTERWRDEGDIYFIIIHSLPS